MPPNDPLTDDELRRRGLDALARELGPADMARFLQQLRTAPENDGDRPTTNATQVNARTHESPPRPAAQPSSVDAANRSARPAEAPLSKPSVLPVEPELDAAGTPPRLLARWLGSRAFLLCGLVAAPVLLLLALWLPQLPRQRAIRAVERAGGEVRFAETIPGWVYGVCGERIEYLEPVSEIHLDGAGVDDGFMPHLRLFNTAHVVWLNEARVTDTGAATLLEFSRITSLDLGETAVTEAVLVPLLRRNPHLETIWLEGTAAGDATLDALSGTRTLQDLYIPRTRITDQGLAHLARLPLLADVDISETSVGDPGMEFLARCPALSKLALDQTQVTDAGLEHLARLPALEQLTLVGTRVTRSGLEHLTRAPRLEKLDLDQTRVGDDGLEHVAAIKSLTLISLVGTRVTDEGLAKLAAARHLSAIYLGGSPITAEGVLRLRQALPDCTVEHAGGGVGHLPEY
jgi:hypothetical protein